MATFRFVGKTDSGPVRCYTGKLVNKGDAVELTPRLAQKARSNPNYEEATIIEQAPEPKPVKKKLSRKKKTDSL